MVFEKRKGRGIPDEVLIFNFCFPADTLYLDKVWNEDHFRLKSFLINSKIVLCKMRFQVFVIKLATSWLYIVFLKLQNVLL